MHQAKRKRLDEREFPRPDSRATKFAAISTAAPKQFPTELNSSPPFPRVIASEAKQSQVGSCSSNQDCFVARCAPRNDFLFLLFELMSSTWKPALDCQGWPSRPATRSEAGADLRRLLIACTVISSTISALTGEA